MKINISQNDHWVGSGELFGGQIVDCSAELPESAYVAIEDAITSGKQKVKVAGDTYTWTLEEDE